MSRKRVWKITCDNCGKSDEFGSIYFARMMGWIHRKMGLNILDYCSDKCSREAK